MGYTTTLLAAVAQVLEDAAVAAWRPAGDYPPGELGIWMVGMPVTDDRAIALTAYAVDDEPALTDVTTGVQVRCRGTEDPRVADDISDAVYDALHGLHDVVLDGIPVGLIWRQSHAPLGPDEAGRYENSSNFYLRAARRSTHRDDT